MKRRAEFLVEKRDGRREWLRAGKLAHSILLALRTSDADEPWRAMDLASAVITGLRSLYGGDSVLTTAVLSAAVHRVLTATGYPVAAGAYELVGAEHRRRREAMGGSAVTDRLSPSWSTGMLGRRSAEDLFSG